MKILTKYLAKEIYSTTTATVLILLLIFMSNQVVRFMKLAAHGSLTSKAVFTIVLLQFPILAAIILPAALFLGILLAYGKLYADSEMIILSGCGLGPQKLLKITLAFSVTIMLTVSVLSLWINPKVYRYFDSLMAGVTTSSLDMIKPKHFNEIAGGSWIFYVDSIAEDRKQFSNIFASQQTDHIKQSSLVARAAYTKIDPNNGGDTYMVLVDGYRYFGTPGQRDYEIIKFKEYGIKIQEEKKTWKGDESSMATTKLWSSKHQPRAAVELQWRISLPLLTIILALIATPLSKIPPKKGRYFKIAPAIILYIIYANLLLLAKAWIKKGILTPTLGVWWVHGFMLIIAIFLIARQMEWSKSYSR